MNSIVSSFKSAVRVQPARAYSPALTTYRAYSTNPSSIGSTPSSSDSPSSSSAPSSSAPSSASTDGQAALDAVIRNVRASKFPTRPTQDTVAAWAQKGPAHRAAFSHLQPSLSQIAASSRAPLFPGQNSLATTPDERWRRLTDRDVQYNEAVTTTSARSVPVTQRNVAQAYYRLNRILQENNVRRELKRQERFESPSNKRVRLNSERHRRRFKVAVGKAVALAMRMKDL
ncbi:hypothetical protein JCM11251_001243 [Rhodosporidiobolus azoricus]